MAAAHKLAGRLAVIHADLVALTEELLSSNTWAGDGIRCSLGVIPSGNRKERYRVHLHLNTTGGLTFTNQYGQRIGGNPEASAKAAAISGIWGRNPRAPIPYKGPAGETLHTRSIRFTRNPPRRE